MITENIASNWAPEATWRLDDVGWGEDYEGTEEDDYPDDPVVVSERHRALRLLNGHLSSCSVQEAARKGLPFAVAWMKRLEAKLRAVTAADREFLDYVAQRIVARFFSARNLEVAS